MFKCALGRLHSPIQLPAQSLPATLYVDAGGQPDKRRVWGGIAAVGELEDAWIDDVVREIGDHHAPSTRVSGEIKGRDLDLNTVVELGKRIRRDNRRILFWSNWYPEPADAIAEKIVRTFALIRAASWRPDRAMIQARNDDATDYLRGLKPVNRWKLLSLIAHLGWLIDELTRIDVARQLKSIRLIVDRENLPDPLRASRFVKLMLAASLQSAGMSLSTTGKVYREEPSEGAITVDVNAESSDCAGLQLVDILLQAVQRRLPGFRSHPIPRPATGILDAHERLN